MYLHFLLISSSCCCCLLATNERRRPLHFQEGLAAVSRLQAATQSPHITSTMTVAPSSVLSAALGVPQAKRVHAKVQTLIQICHWGLLINRWRGRWQGSRGVQDEETIRGWGVPPFTQAPGGTRYSLNRQGAFVQNPGAIISGSELVFVPKGPKTCCCCWTRLQ